MAGSELASLILWAVGPDVLLDDHRDDGSGHCKACTLPQAGPVTWPCTLYNIARSGISEGHTRRSA